MKIKIDWRPSDVGHWSPEIEKTGGNKTDFFGIRIYPETNEEMTDLERFIELGLKPVEIIRILNGDSLHYLIDFEKKK